MSPARLLPLLLCFAPICAAEDPSRFPLEGRWSVATGWKDGWPADWHHAAPTKSTTAAEWTLHEGEMALPGGTLKLRDSERQRSENLREIRRRWQWTGQARLDKVTLSFRWNIAATAARPFLPGISYYDNPAGQSVDAARIPVIAAAQPLRRGFYEEHRFPLPFAAIEGTLDGKLAIAALHTVPSPVRAGHHPDQWWSLGLEYLASGVELAAYSGPVASNGRNATLKGHQRTWHDYDEAWCSLAPGVVVEKTFFVETSPTSVRGAGFQVPLWTAIDLAQPFNADGFPPVQEVIARKFADTVNRWREGPGFAGIHAFPGEKRPWIDLGWAGQSEAFAYPFLKLGTGFGLTEAQIAEKVQRGLDFITTAPFGPEGFAIRYDFNTGRWLDRTNPLSQGQAINNIIDAFRIARDLPAIDTRKWEAFLRRACDFHAARITAEGWRPKSTNEAFLIAPLAKASKLLDTPRYLAAARRAANHYGARHRNMDEPYWGGTLDARCEDKEGAWAALQGFLVMFETTAEPRYLTWARHAADVVLSYVYVWDVPLPPGRLSDHAFKTRGWTAVSPQNMHLDVYGVLCAPALWRLGELLEEPDYQDLARVMYVTCGQLLDPQGGQGEQMHQTNYAQHYHYTDLAGVRGDYVETWNVYWISAHFLVAAAQFEDLGVEWREW
jgi:hypothetical protein